MKLTKETAIDTVQKWIKSSITIEQLECCELFIQDTLYMRFETDSEVTELRLLASNKKLFIIG
jgi:hypothetical protein